MPSFFITGTDTGVGKTWFTCQLVQAWRAKGHRAAGLKPVSAGDRNDALLLREAAGNVLSLDETNPVHLREPAAPLLAARAENYTIDFAAINLAIKTNRANFTHLAVEGVGGWRVPLAPGYEVRDWARELNLPVVVVALDRLGALNHTLLTVESIVAAGLHCAGVVLNPGTQTATSPDFDLARRERASLLREILLLPVLELDRGGEAPGDLPVWLG